jgi:hypothetical protein
LNVEILEQGCSYLHALGHVLRDGQNPGGRPVNPGKADSFPVRVFHFIVFPGFDHFPKGGEEVASLEIGIKVQKIFSFFVLFPSPK